MVKKLSHNKRQRLQFIESRLLWEGTLQRRDICEAFDLTRNHVTREITGYRKQHKRTLVYDTETRVWRIGPDFTPAYATGEPEEYLAMLHAYALSRDPTVMVTVGPIVAAEALPAVNVRVDRAILKEVIVALRRGAGMTVKYQSFSEPEPTQRVLWPHALVYAHSRWHVRAFDGRRQRFADFVLARILQARPVTTERPPETLPKQDQGWEASVTLNVVPAPGLSASQTLAVAREFGMRRQGDTWGWKVTLRRCLAKYFLHAHRLDMAAKDAPKRRIALDKPAIAKDYAFLDD